MIPLNDLSNIKNYLNIEKPRTCQQDCFKELLKHNKSIASMITGSGKSLIEYALINYAFSNNKKFNCIVTDSIMLGQQIAMDYINHLYNGINIYLYNSDSLTSLTVFNTWLLDNYKLSSKDIKNLNDEELIKYENEFKDYCIEECEQIKEQSEQIKHINNINSTLNVDEIIKSDKPVLIISTYQSFHKLKNIDFGTVVFDEAHRTDTKEFQHDLLGLKSDNCYFFTSTPKGNLDKKSGMMNEEIYGKIEYELKYKDAVDSNIIVPFALTTLANTELDTDFKNNKTKSGAYKFSKSIIIKELEKNHVPKIVINLDRKEQTKYTFNNLIKNNLNINLYAVCGGCYLKYDYKSKETIKYNNKHDIMTVAKKDDGPFVILNIMMLNVGIDMPSLTTLGIFSASNSIRVIQSIGRILRVDFADRNKEWSLNKLNHEMVKPFGTVYLNQSGNSKEKNEQIVKKSLDFMMSTFGTMLYYLDPNEGVGKAKGELPEKIISMCNEEFTTDIEEVIIGLNINYKINENLENFELDNSFANYLVSF